MTSSANHECFCSKMYRSQQHFDWGPRPMLKLCKSFLYFFLGPCRFPAGLHLFPSYKRLHLCSCHYHWIWPDQGESLTCVHARRRRKTHTLTKYILKSNDTHAHIKLDSLIDSAPVSLWCHLTTNLTACIYKHIFYNATWYKLCLSLMRGVLMSFSDFTCFLFFKLLMLSILVFMMCA